MTDITARYNEIKESIPDDVVIVAAAKTRTDSEIKEAIEAGIEVIGENYVQEAEKAISSIGDRVKWHMIGHLQRNKVRKAIELFDMVQTVDSLRLAKAIDRRCSEIGREMPVLVEVNSGRESNKTGVLPEELDDLMQQLSGLTYVTVEGLMTMGPAFGDPEEARPYFRETKKAFDRLLGLRIPNIRMRYLSMGMSNSYVVAIQEGSNMIRLGTKLFGPREK